MKKRDPAPSDIADKFMLRLPDGMRDRIRERAGKNCRSMNAEIIAALEKAFPESEKTFINSALKTVFSVADKAECLARVEKANQIAKDNGELIRFMMARKGDGFVIVPYNMVFNGK